MYKHILFGLLAGAFIPCGLRAAEESLSKEKTKKPYILMIGEKSAYIVADFVDKVVGEHAEVLKIDPRIQSIKEDAITNAACVIFEYCTDFRKTASTHIKINDFCSEISREACEEMQTLLLTSEGNPKRALVIWGGLQGIAPGFPTDELKEIFGQNIFRLRAPQFYTKEEETQYKNFLDWIRGNILAATSIKEVHPSKVEEPEGTYVPAVTPKGWKPVHRVEEL